MTRNDELKAGQGLSVERVRALLKAGESFAGANELMGHAHVLAEAYLGSEERVEALALERDRLAHELRLLQEAVGGSAVGDVLEKFAEWREAAEAVREAVRISPLSSDEYEDAKERLTTAIRAVFALSPAQLRALAGQTALLSDDTPERSGGEG